MFKLHAPSMLPMDVAIRFASESFDSPRKIDKKSFVGGWSGDYIGSFRLVDGVRTYRIVCNNSGMWTVTTIPTGV